MCLKGNVEALKSVMCDIIEIQLRRRIEMNRKGNQLLNIKTDVEGPVLNLGLPNFR